ncbi:SdpI family protein [Alicyclobacillus fastidiosus]|uniref:SdpI family protein n=1 Tax=Alicyclobacillus fastidiosus TaxID=392011 RepID=A0ABY6ZJV6_9BACL|nr:SdpI family protein [Alicyclobacillus fastidiosus]WAH43137.1 SdpI family protein [Alicyclobacillus fastidiosus]
MRAVLAVVLGMVAYHHLPALVATHYDLAGKADRMGSRLQAVLVEPATMLGMILLWHVLWRIDPKKRNYKSFWSTYRYIGGVIVVFTALTYLGSLGQLLNIVGTSSMRFMPTVFGIMILLLANVLPRIQPNWWVGIRTPWTLSSATNWNRTHRLAGHLGIPTGILMVILAWVLPKSMISLAVLVPILLWALIAVVASYVYGRQEEH